MANGNSVQHSFSRFSGIIFSCILVMAASAVSVSTADDNACVLGKTECVCFNLTNAGFLVNCSSRSIKDLGALVIPENVTTLILDRNPLLSIPAGFFSNLSVLANLSLKALTAETKRPVDLPNGTFSGLTKLTQLELTGTLLNFDVTTFSNLTSLVYLDLSSTKIITVPNLDACVQLKKLILSGNQLTGVSLGNCCSSLTDLVLANNQIVALSNETFQSVKSLTHLGLSLNQISNISAGALSPLTVLQSIELSRNPITSDVLANVLTSLSPSVVSLKLASTQIKGIQDSAFSKLTALATLDLSNTVLGNVTSKLFQPLEKLTELYLQNATISSLDADAFAKQTVLKTLKLSGNLLTVLPATVFAALSVLEELDFSNQNRSLSQLPLTVFSGLRKLRILNLANNSLGNIVASDVNGTLLSNLSNLVEVHLEANAINSLSVNFFAKLSNSVNVSNQLSYVYLQENRLANWPNQLFAPLASLSRLNLSANNIELINSDAINNLPHATLELDLQGNPWVCNCSLLWFRNWLNSSETVNITVPQWRQFSCGEKSTPPLANVPFANFDNETIDCNPPTPAPPFVESNGFFYGVVVFTFVACLLFVLATVALYRYEIAILLHLFRLRNETQSRNLSRTPQSSSSSRESLLRTSESGFLPLDRSITHDVYVVYADNETDRNWVRGALSSRLNAESYMIRECYPRDLSCTCGWLQRLARMDECANVLIVMSDKLELRQHPGLLQLDIRYVYDRAERLPERFKPPVVVQRGAFCSCGMRQRLPRRLVAQVHCETCRMTLAPSRPRTAASQSESSRNVVATGERKPAVALRWPETHIEEDANEFWNALKAALGPPIVIADVDMNTMRSAAARPDAGSLTVQISPRAEPDPLSPENI